MRVQWEPRRWETVPQRRGTSENQHLAFLGIVDLYHDARSSTGALAQRLAVSVEPGNPLGMRQPCLTQEREGQSE